MATVENFVVKVATQGVEQLTKLGSTADAVNSKMNALGAAILGVGFGSFIKGALESADKMVDLSDATGLSVASIKAFGESMRLAGGDSKGAERAIMTLYGAIEAAADGGLKQQEAFKKVGVSIKDLQSLSEADILQKTVEGLAKIPAGSERAAAATALLGRTFRGVEAERFLETLDPAKYAEFEVSAKKAADTMERFENIFASLQQGALLALEPLLDYLEKINFTAKDAEKLFIGIGTVFALIFGARMIAQVVAFNKALGITAGIANIIGKSPVGLFAKLIAAGTTTAAATATVAALEELMSANDGVAASAEAAGQAQGKIVPTKTGGGPANRTVIVAKTPEQKALEDSQRRIGQITEEINRLRLISSGDMLDQIRQIEINSAADIAKAREEIFSRENLNKQQKQLEFEAKNKEIALKGEVEIQRLRIEAKNTLNEQLRTYSLTLADKEREIALSQELVNLSGMDQQKRREMLAIEQQMLAAIEQARLVKNAAPEETQRIIDGIREQAAATKEAIAANIEYQNSFEAGWARAFNSYLDNATNASRQAEAMFQTMTSNMNSALDRFVDTGKFSFSDLANSIIRDIIKIQLRASVANLIGGTGGGGSGVLGALAGIFRANGGPVNANSPYIVGEKGAELFVPSSAGTIIPNSKMSSGGTAGSSVTYYINAVDASSFKQMLARDPAFLHAVSEQGRKTVPQTRR